MVSLDLSEISTAEMLRGDLNDFGPFMALCTCHFQYHYNQIPLMRFSEFSHFVAGPGQHLTPEEFHRILTIHSNAHKKDCISNTFHATDLIIASDLPNEDTYRILNKTAEFQKCDVLSSSGNNSSDCRNSDGNSNNAGDDNTGSEIGCNNSDNGCISMLRQNSSDIHALDKIKNNLVLIDVRNYYETRIGRFQLNKADSGVLTVIDPKTRQVRYFLKDDWRERIIMMIGLLS